MVTLEYFSGIISALESQLWTFEEVGTDLPLESIKGQLEHLRGQLAEVNQWRRRVW